MDITKNIFTLIAMVIVSFSVGFIAWANIGFMVTSAAVVAMGVFLAQFIGYLMIWKTFVYDSLHKKIDALTLDEAENANGIERLSNEMQGLRKVVKTATQAEIEPLARELEVVISLIKQLAENSADTEMRIADIQQTQNALKEEKTQTPPTRKKSKAPTTKAPSRREQVKQVEEDNIDEWFDDEPDEITQPEQKDTVERAPVEEPLDDNSPIMKAIRAAVDANKVDLYLQPIVTLPQRKPIFYEALSRIRTKEGDLIRPAQYMRSAEQSGAMPILDKMLLVRAVQVLQRLLARKSDSVVVCNIAASSLADTRFFNDFRMLLKAKNNLADHLIFEFNQETVHSFGAIEEESIRALKDLGFRFAIDNVTDISMDFQRLSELGFHFIKVSADILLSAKTSGIKDIHAQDVPRFLSRNGIELIVDHIETEGQVIELLDFEVKFGQGYLFAAPREVKPDVTMVRTPIDDRLAS